MKRQEGNMGCLSFSGLLPKYLKWLEMRRSETRRKELPLLSPPHGYRGPSTWTIFSHFPSCIVRKLEQMWSSKDSNWWLHGMLVTGSDFTSFTVGRLVQVSCTVHMKPIDFNQRGTFVTLILTWSVGKMWEHSLQLMKHSLTRYQGTCTLTCQGGPWSNPLD